LIHRTYWTAKNQSKRANIDSQEEINNFHIFFTLNAIFSYVSKFTPDTTILVWDEKKDYQVNERKAQFSDYKGNRSQDSTPHQNNNAIKTIAQYLGIPSIFPRQYEADDIVSYICRFTAGNKTIISVDKDFLQLVNDNTTLYDPIRKVEYNAQNFEEKTGYKNTIDWLTAKCITGDKSDNVPGIYKFGKAKIARLLKGEVKLTAEEEEVYNRNYALFNLSAILPEHDEAVYYKEQLENITSTDWNAFINTCKDLNFNTILNKKEAWYSLFFLKNKLKALFG
jgi:5'-3' exonuclease